MKILLIQVKNCEKQDIGVFPQYPNWKITKNGILEFSHSALFYMKSKICLKYFSHDRSSSLLCLYRIYHKQNIKFLKKADYIEYVITKR